MAALEIRKLGKRFGRVEALRDVSLRVESGQVFGLLGPNGAGKTTTLACALGLMRPTMGEAFVLGRPPRRLKEVRGRVGVVFDRAVLLPGLSARGNLEYARRFSGTGEGRSPDDVLGLVGLSDMARRRAGTLSLGQARRLSIACALLGRPELLVLDEPLSGLDTLGVRAMLALFRRLAEEGASLVLSSHRLHEMETVITHGAVLLAGSVARAGSLDELRDGGRALVVVECSPAERARRILEAMDGVEPEPDAGDGELRVRLEGVTSAALNRALVDGGCDVSRLEPLSASLHSVFERLVDERERGGVT